VCAHPDAVEINEAIVGVGGKKSNRVIARQYDLHHDAVRRHREHIPKLLLEAAKHTEAFEIDSILMRIEDLERETLNQLEELKDEEDPDRKTILLAIREQRSNIELVAKAWQLIDKASQVHVHISDQAYAAIVGALEYYPEAQFAVVDALAPLAELEERG
jgi:hypothetical protein